jgi:hypothetical protein
MADRAGGVFNKAEEVRERLHQAPGEEARKEMAATPEGPPPSRWTLRAVRASFPWMEGYTLGGVSRFLAACDLEVRSAQVRHYSPDPDYLVKQDRLLECLREAALAPDRVVALFLDEMGYTRWPDPAPSWALKAPADLPVAARGTENNRQWRIVGSLNALTGQTHYLDNYIAGRELLIKHYGQIDAAYPDVEVIYVAQDNWSIHKHADVLAALEGLPRIKPVWLPTYAPWLNPIEKLWRWLRQDVLKMHRLSEDWDALRARVKQFLDQFAEGSEHLLHYVGLLGEGRLALALRPG